MLAPDTDKHNAIVADYQVSFTYEDCLCGLLFFLSASNDSVARLLASSSRSDFAGRAHFARKVCKSRLADRIQYRETPQCIGVSLTIRERARPSGYRSHGSMKTVQKGSREMVHEKGALQLNIGAAQVSEKKVRSTNLREMPPM